ncbi:MAG: hypothetical protein ABI881_16970, partial [Betaproteobacteria bacterium]
MPATTKQKSPAPRSLKSAPAPLGNAPRRPRMRTAGNGQPARHAASTHATAGRDRSAVAAKGVITASAATERIRELAWAGQHAAAIELATAELAAPDLSAASRLDLLQLRAESFIAQGKLDPASSDAASMLTLAALKGTQSGMAAAKAQALCTLAMVQMRASEYNAALKAAQAALKAAREGEHPRLEALALLRLAEAQIRTKASDKAVANATLAAERFAVLRDIAGEGRALWARGSALTDSERFAEARESNDAALVRARQAGDYYGMGNALNGLNNASADLGTRLELLSQAFAAFARAGYPERQAIILSNTGTVYLALGLYRRARRLYASIGEIGSTAGTRALAVYTVEGLSDVEFMLGNIDRASELLEQWAVLAGAIGDPDLTLQLQLNRGVFALGKGDVATALRELRRHLKLVRDRGAQLGEVDALAWIAKASLVAGKPTEAASATRRAVRLIRKFGLKEGGIFTLAPIWWQHSRATAANNLEAESRDALEQAYRAVCARIANVSDEGLRRNFLNKPQDHRDIIGAWVADATKRRLAP